MQLLTAWVRGQEQRDRSAWLAAEPDTGGLNTAEKELTVLWSL